MKDKEVYYGSYLQLDKIIEAQELESEKAGKPAHDEMLFIIVHQAYELWFKQILHELESIVDILSVATVNDNSPAMYSVVHRVDRIVEILRLLVQQINVIETMTPLDFLDFRNQLRPASGFQSFQFKMIEAILGLEFEQRHGRDYYTSMLRDEHIAKIKQIENRPTVIQLVNSWLERTPFFDNQIYWSNYQTDGSPSNTQSSNAFWHAYRSIYADGLLDAEKNNLESFDSVFLTEENLDATRKLSSRANRAALFIMLYRDYPLLQMPYKLLNGLLEVDELMATWRYRHMNMVHRMIGGRVGTGGSSGKKYLRDAMDKHYIFSEIAELASFMIERQNLPKLSKELETKLGFEMG